MRPSGLPILFDVVLRVTEAVADPEMECPIADSHMLNQDDW